MPVARFEMPDGRIARFEVPEGTTPEQAQSLFDQYVQQNPATFAQTAPSQPEKPVAPPEPTMMQDVSRKIGVVGRGVTEALAPVAAGALAGGMVAGPPGAAGGALLGGVVVPLADFATMGYNALLGKQAQLPSEAISSLIPGPRAETPTERVLQAAGGAAGGTGAAVRAGQVLAKAPTATGALLESAEGARAVGREAARATVPAAAVTTGVGQTVTEVTENPFLGMAAGVAAGATSGLKPAKYEKIDKEEVIEKAKQNYNILDNSDFEIKPDLFKVAMGDSAKDLRNKGYNPRLMPGVTAAIEEMLSDNPKNLRELQTIRTFIKNASSSKEPSERRVALQLLDDFDEYVLNAQPTKGSPAVIDAWVQARKYYGQTKRAEVFETMLLNAEVAPSSPQAYMRSEIRKLARDPKKMRLFTEAQQESIREAAKSDNLQSSLELIAKFTPMTPAAAIFTAVAPFGAYTATAGMAAKDLAGKRRLRELEKLQTEMLLGRKPQMLQGPLRDMPAYTGRSAINMLNPVMMQETQNALMD
jgi:methionine aminopeptidase